MENTNIKKDETSTIKSLLEKGKDSGSLTYAEIAEALSTFDLDKDVIENTYETLSQLGIELVDEENKDVAKKSNVFILIFLQIEPQL